MRRQDAATRGAALGGMGNSDSNAFRLHVLGAPDLRAPDGRRVASVLSQPKRLGLLAYLALVPEPVTRARLVALFWPESDEARARNALSQAVFYLRRSLDERVVQSYEGDRLWAPPEHLWCDARERLRGSAGEAAAAKGDLLDGWNAEDSQELQDWLDAERRRIREGAARAAGASATPGIPAAVGALAAAGAPAAATLSVASMPAARPPATRPPAASSPAPVRIRRALSSARLLIIATLSVLVVSVVTLSLMDDRAQGVVLSGGGSLAVLMPQIAAAAGAPEIDAAAIHAEILAALPHAEGVRIVSANYAGSLQDFRRQLAALGVAAPEEPRWILEVSIRVTAHEARGVGLLHRVPEYDLPGRVSFDVTYASAEAALLEAPEEVAREVAGMVEEVLSAAGGG